MDKEKVYYSIGDAAKKMNISIRTLQYYDREGVLKPSAYSNGGRRLYNDKDLVQLHQILSFKRIGFSLRQIREQIKPLSSPKEILQIIVAQKQQLKLQIEKLKLASSMIEELEKEIEKVGSVDFGKYELLLGSFMYNSSEFWVFNSMEKDLLNHISNRFAQNPDAAMRICKEWNEFSDKIVVLVNSGITPQAEESVKLIDAWWNMVLEFTGGDTSVLSKLMKFDEDKANWSDEKRQRQEIVDKFIEEAMSYKISLEISKNREEEKR